MKVEDLRYEEMVLVLIFKWIQCLKLEKKKVN